MASVDAAPQKDHVVEAKQRLGFSLLFRACACVGRGREVPSQLGQSSGQAVQRPTGGKPQGPCAECQCPAFYFSEAPRPKCP